MSAWRRSSVSTVSGTTVSAETKKTASNCFVISAVVLCDGCGMGVLKAIVAMSLNRVIGKNNKLPWHLPEDLRWFKKLTTGNVVIMGRKTWDSIGKPLPNRENIVMTRSDARIPGARTIRALSELNPASDPRDYFIIGGAQIFEAYLPLCAEVYLTLVKREVDGDVFLPRFEEQFQEAERIAENAEFSILRYKRLGGSAPAC